MTPEPDRLPADTIRGDAGWLMHRIDAAARRVLFVRLREDEVRAASFLDDRIGIAGRESWWLDLGELASVAMLEPPAGFIFHIGHCGSTLVSRLLDLAPDVLGLREPQVLRDLAGLHRALHRPGSWIDPDRWPALVAAMLGLLGRRFVPQQRVVVKATSGCNDLAGSILGAAPVLRVVLLHIPLRAWLATLMKGPARDALQFAPSRLAWLQAHLGVDLPGLYRLQPAEILALGWVAEMARFEALTGVAGERALRVDFESLLADPAAGLATVRRHLHLPDGVAPDSGARSAVLAHYAKKPDHPYTPDDRAHDLALAQRRFAAGITQATQWTERLIARHPVLAPLTAWLG
jgi:hypothetical protein